MKVKYFVLFLLLNSLIYLCSCDSSSYTITETDSPDTIKTVKQSIPKDTNQQTLAQLKEKYPKKIYRIRTRPQFTLQFNAGYNYGIAELNANYSSGNETDDFESGLNFGARQGFSIFSLGKIPLNMDGSIRFIFIGAFNYFLNKSLTSNYSNSGTVKYYVYSIGSGFENSFTPAFSFKPYFGASILFNLLNGGANYVNNSGQNIDLTIKPTFRIGLNVSAGIEYLLSDKIGLNFGMNLTSANLLFKSSNTSEDPYRIYLRDKKVTVATPGTFLMYGGYKQFLFTTFYLGVNIYFGIKGKSFQI